MASKKPVPSWVEHPFFDYGPLEDHLRSLTGWTWCVEDCGYPEHDSVVCVLEIDIHETDSDESIFSYEYFGKKINNKMSRKAIAKWEQERGVEIKRLELVIQPLILAWMKEMYPHLLAHITDNTDNGIVGTKIRRGLRLYVINGPVFGINKLPSDAQQEIFNMLKEI
jgi:hypothetical protein